MLKREMGIKMADQIRYTSCLVIGLLMHFHLLGQLSEINGQVLSAQNEAPVSFANIYSMNSGKGAIADDNGYFQLFHTGTDTLTLRVSRIGYQTKIFIIDMKEHSKSKLLTLALEVDDSDIEVIVEDQRLQSNEVIEEMDPLLQLPTTTGNLESILPSIGLGVNSGTGGELSSQYNVRGGNYDENLIYVNDFSIYRPQLIRSSQQEGLTFPNPNLIQSLQFSSGGFDAQYGDKLSSVLDVRYKQADSIRGSVEGSALGASVHFEGGFLRDDKERPRLRILAGYRYKTTRYLLGSLETTGEYIPNFHDIQAQVSYTLNDHWEITLLTNYNQSVYSFAPESRSTAFGLVTQVLQLNSVYQGQEQDDFTTSMAGATLKYERSDAKNPYYIKIQGSGFRSLENEKRDILGFYRLGETSNDLSGNRSDEIINLLGTGTQHNYNRNYLDIAVKNIQILGGVEHSLKNEKLSLYHKWGLKWQNERIEDEINEWERLDSAGYSLPYNDQRVELLNVLKSSISIRSNRFTAFAQSTINGRGSIGKYSIAGGLRAQYWDLNHEFFINPRMKFMLQPANNSSITYRFSSGLYYQPPFYRELRRRNGTINTNTLAQKSIHFVAGMTKNLKFKNTDRPFKFITEIYYKRLWDLISYDVDNVKIRYSGQNDATGYVIGADFRINGEFVEGAESWINLSILSARESLNNVQHMKREIGDTIATAVNRVPRPSDQTVTASIFFQDYLPRNENFKTHVQFSLGTGLPFGIRENNTVFRNTYRFPIYHRTDIGFSIRLWQDSWSKEKPKHFLRFSRNAWVSLEIFNLMQVKNEASKTWIKTIFLQEYAVPNYLTSRRINLRLRFEI